MDLTPAQMLLYSAIKLTTSSNGVTTGSGTGFFYEIPVGDDKAVYLIITNKHVIDGADHVEAIFHISKTPHQVEPTGAFRACNISLQDHVVYHPDPDVDLCGILITDLFVKAEAAGIALMRMPAVRSSIPTEWDAFDAIEEVVMVGCPNGLYDTASNLPIARRGITATPLSNNYLGKPQFVVDMACFPGSSGSPIYLFNQTGFLDVKTRSIRFGETRLLLVGVLFAGPLITNSGTIVMSKKPTFEMSSTMHLGYAIRASAIFDLEGEVHRLRGTGVAV
jgi:hypothetical protein